MWRFGACLKRLHSLGKIETENSKKGQQVRQVHLEQWPLKRCVLFISWQTLDCYDSTCQPVASCMWRRRWWKPYYFLRKCCCTVFAVRCILGMHLVDPVALQEEKLWTLDNCDAAACNSRVTWKFPVSRESFPCHVRVSRVTREFPVSRESFPCHERVSRVTREFPVSRESFPCHERVSRVTREFLVSRESFPCHVGVSRNTGECPVTRESFPYIQDHPLRVD